MAFRWFRGGSWALLDAPPAGKVIAHATAPFDPYTIQRFPEIDHILDSYVAFWRRNNPIAVGIRQREGEVVPPLETRLLSLLEEHGPLQRMSGFLHTGPSGTPRKVSRTIDLNFFSNTSRWLSEAWRGLNEPLSPRERENLADDLLDGPGRHTLQTDMEIIPGFRNDRFVYDIAPVSLQAVLWERVFRVYGRDLRVACRFCGEVFEPEPARGRTPDYCPSHRGSRFRQAVLEGRAPVQRFTGRFNLNQLGALDV